MGRPKKNNVAVETVAAPKTKPVLVGEEALEVAWKKFDVAERKYEISATATKALKADLEEAQQELNEVAKSISDPKAMPLLNQPKEEGEAKK